MSKLRGKFGKEVKRGLCILMAAAMVASGTDLPVNAAGVTENAQEAVADLSLETVRMESVDMEAADTKAVDTKTIDTEAMDTENPDTEAADTETEDTEASGANITDTERSETETTAADGKDAGTEDGAETDGETAAEDTESTACDTEQTSETDSAAETNASSDDTVTDTEEKDSDDTETELSGETETEEDEETAIVEQRLNAGPTEGFALMPSPKYSGIMPGEKFGTWTIDTNGKLTVTGTGEFRLATSNRLPWNDYLDEIKTAKIARKGATNFFNLFAGCKNLTSVDFSECDTSKATTMYGMFYGCKNLEELNLGNFNTANVTNMSYMFVYCEKLRKIEFGQGFKTDKVTNMSNMFYECESLEQIDLSRFNTANVVNMSYMFFHCLALEELDLSSFDTGKVTNMSCMLNGLRAASLDLSKFDMSNVVEADNMLNSYILIELKTPRNVKVSIPFMYGTWMKADGIVLAELPKNLSQSIPVKQKMELVVSKNRTEYETGDKLDLSDLTVELLYSKSGNTYYKRETITDYTTNAAGIDMNTAGTKDLIVSYQGQSVTIKLTVLGKTLVASKQTTTYLANSTLSVSDLSVKIVYTDGSSRNVSSTAYTTNAASIDMSTVGTKDLIVTYQNMTATVKITVNPEWTYYIKARKGTTTYYCGETLDLSDLTVELYGDKKNVHYGKYFGEITDYTTNAASIDLRTPGTKELIISARGSTTTVTLTVEPAREFGSIEFGGRCVFETGENLHDFDIWLDIESADGKKMWLVSEYQSNMDEIDMSTPGRKTVQITWHELKTELDIYVIDAFCDDDIAHGRKDNIAYKIDKDGNLTVVGKGRCDIVNIAPARPLWLADAQCSDIKTAKLIMDEAKNIDSLFSGCGNLKSVDLSDFDTSIATDMSNMFFKCSSLTSLDLSGFDTSNVTDMDSMFRGCVQLKSLDLSNFNTTNVTRMSKMFDNCKNLTELDLSSFDTTNVADMSHMFSYSESLAGLDLSSFDTSNVAKMGWMFCCCESLKSLDLGNFDMKNVTSAWSMLEGCSELTALHTPKNMKVEFSLPDGDWFDADGNKVKSPLSDMDRSVYITKDRKTSEEKPEEESSSSEESSSVEESSSSEESSDIEESSEVEESSSSEESSDIEESSEVEESSSSEESSDIEESSEVEESSSSEESSDIEESSEVEESSSSEESSKVEDSSSGEEDSSGEENSGEEESSDTEESTGTETSPYTDKERTDFNHIAGTISAIKAKTYDGNPYEPAVKVTVTSNKKKITLTEGTDYSVTYRNNVDAGTATAVVKGNGIYKGELTASFTIQPKSIKSFKAYANNTTVDCMSEPTVNIFDGTKLLENGKDYTLVYDRDLTDIGRKSADVKIVAKGNYKDSKVVKITVYDGSTPKFFTQASLAQTEYDYTGKAVKPEVTVKAFSYEGEILVLNRDYKVQYKNNINAGTAYAVVTGKGQYKGNVIIPFTIKPLAASGIALTVSKISDKTYNGKLQKPSVTVKCGKKKLVKNKDYTIAYTDNLHTSTDSRKAKVIITGKGNYAGVTATAEFTIKPQKISKAAVKGTKDNLAVSYGRTPLKEDSHYTVTPDESSVKKNKIKVTITGLGDFAGSTVTKTVKLK